MMDTDEGEDVTSALIKVRSVHYVLTDCFHRYSIQLSFSTLCIDQMETAWLSAEAWRLVKFALVPERIATGENVALVPPEAARLLHPAWSISAEAQIHEST